MGRFGDKLKGFGNNVLDFALNPVGTAFDVVDKIIPGENPLLEIAADTAHVFNPIGAAGTVADIVAGIIPGDNPLLETASAFLGGDNPISQIFTDDSDGVSEITEVVHSDPPIPGTVPGQSVNQVNQPGPTQIAGCQLKPDPYLPCYMAEKKKQDDCKAAMETFQKAMRDVGCNTSCTHRPVRRCTIKKRSSTKKCSCKRKRKRSCGCS